MPVCRPLSHPSSILSVRCVRQVSVECLGLKPDWLTNKILLSLRNFSVWMWTTFSNIFEKRGNREIGRSFFCLSLDPFAILQRSGNEEKRIDKFIILVKWNAIISAPSFMKMPESLSIPAAFEIFVFENKRNWCAVS